LSFLLIALVVLAIVALWVRWQEPRSIFFPVRQVGPYPLPDGFAPEDVYLETPDGVRLHGWFHNGSQAPGDTLGSQAAPGAGLTVLYLHGNAGNLSNRIEKILLLESLGLDVLIVDYRGYGLSDGTPSEQGFYRDARTAHRYLTAVRRVDPRAIVLLGESLGSAVAIDLAREVQAGGLVIEAAFTSIPDVAQALYPFLPVRWFLSQRFDSIAKIGDVRAPILLFHSVDDEYFPLHHPQRLMAAAKTGTRLVELRGTHDQASIESRAIYCAGLASFLETIQAR